MRAAIQQEASRSRRHAAHAALADVLADQPDRSRWHRAASTNRPDEEMAAELETAARRARRRGDLLSGRRGPRTPLAPWPQTRRKPLRIGHPLGIVFDGACGQDQRPG